MPEATSRPAVKVRAPRLKACIPDSRATRAFNLGSSALNGASSPSLPARQNQVIAVQDRRDDADKLTRAIRQLVVNGVKADPA